MPKLRKPDNYFEINVRSRMLMRGLSPSEFARKSKMSLPTLYARFSSPKTLTLGELKTFSLILSCTMSELMENVKI